MKTIILSAGRSKRLKPIPDKSLIYFNGKPTLQHKLESLSLEGFSDFVIVVGAHNKNEIAELTKKLPYQVNLVEQTDLDQGMAGAVKAVHDFQKASNKLEEAIFITSNNDTVDQSLLRKFAEQIEISKSNGLIAGKKVEQYFPGGYIQHDDELMLTSIIEKPTPGTEPSDMINLVYHYFANPTALYDSVLNQLASNPTDYDGIYELALHKLVESGQKIKVVPYAGSWHPIKTPADIIATARYFTLKEHARGIHPKAEVHPSAIIAGEVILEEGVVVHANAVIQGPAYIGKHSVVANNALVRDSYVGSNCVIGFATEVARSYIGNNTWFHKNYIGDSVIGQNVSFGAGTVTGNLRLDESPIDGVAVKVGLVTGDNIRVGINTSFMPGLKIGSNTMIGAGLTIAQDIPDNSFVKAETINLVIKENTKPIPLR